MSKNGHRLFHGVPSLKAMPMTELLYVCVPQHHTMIYMSVSTTTLQDTIATTLYFHFGIEEFDEVYFDSVNSPNYMCSH